MPNNQQHPSWQLTPELRGFPFAPVRTEQGLPVFRGKQARKELTHRFGLPNAAPRPGESPFGNTWCLFVDDGNNGKPIAYLEPEQ